MGVGTLTTYRRPGDYLRIYEINPEVRRIAERYFTYLADSRADIDVIMGDARLSLERETPQEFDILVIDAFTGDAIPMHLLTKEAFEEYSRHLKPDGVIAVLIATHLDLGPVVRALSEHLGLDAVRIINGYGPDEDWGADWMLVSQSGVPRQRCRPSRRQRGAGTIQCGAVVDGRLLEPVIGLGALVGKAHRSDAGSERRSSASSGAAMVYPFTFVLAFCSLVYELLLGQSLSAFLGNTVLRYSVTIGLYMLSMGLGSLLAEGRFVKHAVISLQRIEVALAVTGGFCVLFLHVLDLAGLPTIVFSAFAHLLIVVIGILTGFEIPILMELRKLHSPGADNTVLGVDYLGAFFGTLVFAFVFFPIVGLVPTAFWLYPDFPKSTNTLYLYILRAKLSVRPAQVDGIYVNIISHGSTPARTRACSDTTPRPDALYRALSRLDAVSDQAHVNVTHCQI